MSRATTLGGHAARRPGGDELDDGRDGRRGVGAPASTARSRASPLPSEPPRSARRAPRPCSHTTSSKTFVSSRQTATSRSGSTAARLASVAGRRFGDSNATVGCGHALSSCHSAARSRSRSRDVADEPVLVAREPARDECRLDGRRPRQHRHRRHRRRAQRRRAWRPGSLTPGSPASETSAIRSPADEPRHELGGPRRLVVPVVREEPRLDPVALAGARACAACPRRGRCRRRRARRARAA